MILKLHIFPARVLADSIGNKHKNCVRLKHKETGIITTGQNERSLDKNKKTAFNRMVKHPDFQKWLKIKTSKATVNEEEIKRKVERMMSPENIKVEYGNAKNKM